MGGAGPLAAALADVGLLPSVLAHVGDEGAGLGEGFAAHHALAWLLAWGRAARDVIADSSSSCVPSPAPRPPELGSLTHPCGCGRAAAERPGRRTAAGSGCTRKVSPRCGSEGAALGSLWRQTGGLARGIGRWPQSGGCGQPGSLALPEVVNCFPHSRHLRGPSAMWILRWAFRFPTCARQGSERHLTQCGLGPHPQPLLRGTDSGSSQEPLDDSIFA